jgi:hypothetical protein
MRATYYGLLLTLLFGLAVAASCWAATFLGWRSAYDEALPALFGLWGAASLAEGLALVLDWKGSASQFQTLKLAGNLSAVDRLLTWEIGRDTIGIVTWYRILGWFLVAQGVVLIAVVAVH